MSGKTTIFLVILLVLLAGVFAGKLQAEVPDIFYHGENITDNLNPVNVDGSCLVEARSLADELDLELEWVASLKYLNLSRDDTDIRIMIDNPYMQIGEDTIKTETGARLIEGSSYVPVEDVVRAFGYLTNQEEVNNLYIFKPETKVHEAYWSEDQRKLYLDMDEVTPYRITATDDPSVMKIEIDRAALADDFVDNVSNRNFNLRVRENQLESRLEIIVSSLHTIPYRRDGGIEESGTNLVVNFMPRLVNIEWKDDFLEIAANSEMERPEITMLDGGDGPRKMVIDIPNLMLSEIDLDIEENDYIKDIRMSQFSYDPMKLRVVLELAEDSYLGLDEKASEEKLVLRPTQQTVVRNLAYETGKINFETSSEIIPTIFTLTEPDRLVINMLNASRADDIPDRIDVDNSTMQEIRTARFDQETVRFVAELTENTGYNWEMEEQEDGSFLHTILLENKLREIYVTEQNNFQNLHIDFTGNVDYEVRKFSHPHRIAIDIKNLENGLDDYNLPEPDGLIKEVRTGQLEIDGEDIRRIVFELNDFHSYNIMSGKPDSEIMVALAKQELDDISHVIVLDAGHGGFDPGAVAASGLEEKDVVLAVALKTAEILEGNDHQVLLTRQDDRFVTLQDRVDKANNSEASLFVSIHANAANRNNVGGLETYYGNGRRRDSYYLADVMQKALVGELDLLDRGVKTDNFFVIRNTEMPAILVEIGFLSNLTEAELLAGDTHRNKTARSLAEGIETYLTNIQRREEE
ncbi:MAG: N-acetylmuramoyl-L-alanine amidase [Bacillota bacterium]